MGESGHPNVLPEQWHVLATLLLVMLPLIPLLLGGRRRKDSSLRPPPGPWRLPIIGNLHQIGALPHRSLRALAQRHGPVMMLRLGTVPTAVLSSPEAAREALKTHDADCSSRAPSPGPRMLSYGFKDVVFSPYSEYVREMRKLFVLELLSMRRVQAACYAREAQVQKLVETLTRIGPKPVRVNDHIFATLDGIIGLFAFGETYAVEQFKEQFVKVMDETMDTLGSFSAEDFFPNAAGRLIDRLTGLVACRDRVFKKLDGFLDLVIEQYLDAASAHTRTKPAGDNGGSGSGLVKELIELWKKYEITNGFTRDHVKALLMDTLIASIEASSVTMHWAMSELIRHPRVLNKLQHDIRAAVGGKQQVQHDDLPSIKYLRMVVKETLRLHPPATLLVPRETIRNITVGGYDIPARTKVIVNAWAIGRDHNVWKDPEEFYPDRFEETDIDFNGAHFELIPFGSGRRICPGLSMATVNIEFTLANMFYYFDWTPPDGVRIEDISMEEAGGLTFHKKTPLMLVPTRYTLHD